LYKWFEEEYIVTFNLMKTDGYWEIGKEESVFIPVSHGINEKNNHSAVLKALQDMYKGQQIKVVSVSYV